MEMRFIRRPCFANRCEPRDQGGVCTPPANGYAASIERPAHATADGRVAKALAAMTAEPERPWTVERLAKLAGLSRPAFARLFVLYTGESPRRYLRRVRLELAAELLRDGEASLAEVAHRVGYESEFAFNRAFKRSHGVSPGTFRRGVSRGPVCLALAA